MSNSLAWNDFSETKPEQNELIVIRQATQSSNVINFNSTLPFVELDLENTCQKSIYDRVVEASKEIYDINDTLINQPAKRVSMFLQKKKLH